MGLLGNLFTAFTAPAGSTAYVIKKDGQVLKTVEAQKDGTYKASWTSWSLKGNFLTWKSEGEAKQFATSSGFNLSEIKIEWVQVSR